MNTAEKSSLFDALVLEHKGDASTLLPVLSVHPEFCNELFVLHFWNRSSSGEKAGSFDNARIRASVQCKGSQLVATERAMLSIPIFDDSDFYWNEEEEEE